MNGGSSLRGIGSAAAWPLMARAQQQTKPTIAWLEANPEETPPDFFEPFRRGLAEFGFSEGRDVTVEFHNIAGHGEPWPALVVDVARRRPAAIIAIGVGAASAAKAATRDIPIIFFRALIRFSWGWWRALIVRAAISRCRLS